jgi:hypothetical protein
MENNVLLGMATSKVTPSGMGSYRPSGCCEIIVKNLNYHKNVSLLTKQGGLWKDLPAHYVKSINQNYELWTFLSSTYGGEEFVVKYEDNGETYWDNNNWKNYKLPTAGSDLNAILGSNFKIALGNASIRDNKFSATIAIENIDYNKIIGMVYTKDNWQTHQLSYGKYKRTFSSGLEEWIIEFYVGSYTRFIFALFYKAIGNTHWDNNFGRNYSITPDRNSIGWVC